MVDDFGVKYVGQKCAEHLINTILEHYQVSTDWEGKRYHGIIINWNYQKQAVKLSMPGYIKASLQKFEHSPPTTKYHAPLSWERSNFGATHQLTKAEDTSQKFTPRTNPDITANHRDTTLLPQINLFDNTDLPGGMSAAQTSGITTT